MRLRVSPAAAVVAGIAAATVVLASCVASTANTAAPLPTLTETINTQLAREDAFPWAVRRPLTWADFKGKPPANPGVVAAETAYTIIHGVRCVGSKFEFRVVAAFRPRDSWVRQAALRTPADSARALRHEQTHFDLSEVHARRLRRYFGELMAPCSSSSNNLEARADQIERDEKAAQELYDRESDHGRSPAAQARWDKEVDGQLVSLAKFVR